LRRAYLELGSNLGERFEHLRAGVSALAAAEGVRMVRVSGVYSSEPVGLSEQPEFLNIVVEIETELEPRRLLSLAREIEAGRGRERKERWGPRTLDVDILLYGDLELADPELTIPHPRMAERRFVLEPLCEIAPEAALPDGTAVGELLVGLEDDRWVRRDRDLVIE